MNAPYGAFFIFFSVISITQLLFESLYISPYMLRLKMQQLDETQSGSPLVEGVALPIFPAFGRHVIGVLAH